MWLVYRVVVGILQPIIKVTDGLQVRHSCSCRIIQTTFWFPLRTKPMVYQELSNHKWDLSVEINQERVWKEYQRLLVLAILHGISKIHQDILRHTRYFIEVLKYGFTINNVTQIMLRSTWLAIQGYFCFSYYTPLVPPQPPHWILI